MLMFMFISHQLAEFASKQIKILEETWANKKWRMGS